VRTKKEKNKINKH